ncbi:MAG: gamma-glutamylcyclotransferase [Bacteroidia bacterium]|nr:gamma-glutamylcyclotransferase [Bacteroidia bacterium]
MPNLFSYGTLQLSKVQTALFKRYLKGQADVLEGYTQEEITIGDETVVSLSNKATHLIIKYTGNPKDQINGVVYELTEAELAIADQYETADYRRELVVLASGTQSWVYVK